MMHQRRPNKEDAIEYRRMIQGQMAAQAELDTEVRKPGSIFQELQQEVGGGFGDWIRSLAKPIATVMGKEHCSTCEARRIVTNAYGKLRKKHGQAVALGMVKDLWALSYKADGEAVLLRLKEMLDD